MGSFTTRDEFIRYRIAVCDAKSKFCDAKLNDSQKIAMQSDFDRAKIMLFECYFRACMNACTCGLFQCAPCDQRSSLVRDFFLFVCIMSCLCAGHSILATFHVCCTHVVFLIFDCAVLITSCKLRLTA